MSVWSSTSIRHVAYNELFAASAQTLMQTADLQSVIPSKIVAKAMMRALEFCKSHNNVNSVGVQFSMGGSALRLCLLPHLHQPACPPAAAEAPWL